MNPVVILFHRPHPEGSEESLCLGVRPGRQHAFQHAHDIGRCRHTVTDTWPRRLQGMDQLVGRRLAGQLEPVRRAARGVSLLLFLHPAGSTGAVVYSKRSQAARCAAAVATANPIFPELWFPI